MWWVIKVFRLGEMFSHCEFKVYQSFAKNANKSFPPLCFQQLEAFTAKKNVKSFLSKVGTCCLLSTKHIYKPIYRSQTFESYHTYLKWVTFCTYISWNQHLETFSVYHTCDMTIFPSCIQFQILIAKTNISEN